MYIYIYIYVYIYMCIYINIHTYIHTHTYRRELAVGLVRAGFTTAEAHAFFDRMDDDGSDAIDMIEVGHCCVSFTCFMTHFHSYMTHLHDS